MSEKPLVSGRETYVLDEDDIEALDQASLTGVMRDITGTIEKLEVEEREALPDEIEVDDDWSALLSPAED